MLFFFSFFFNQESKPKFWKVLGFSITVPGSSDLSSDSEHSLLQQGQRKNRSIQSDRWGMASLGRRRRRRYPNYWGRRRPGRMEMRDPVGSGGLLAASPSVGQTVRPFLFRKPKLVSLIQREFFLVSTPHFFKYISFWVFTICILNL